MKRMIWVPALIGTTYLLGCSGGSSSADSGGDAAGDSSGEDGDESGDEGGDDGGDDGGVDDGPEVSSFSVAQCQGDTGSMPTGDDALSASVSDGVIDVEHLAVTGNCCPEGWDIGVVVDGSELDVWYYGDGDCDCECLYDLEYQITGVESGTWTLNAGGASLEVEVP